MRLILAAIAVLIPLAGHSEYPAPFYKRFTGTAGPANSSVTLHVAFWPAREKTNVEGHFFLAAGANVPLTGTFNGTRFLLTADTGQLSLAAGAEPNSLSGTWTPSAAPGPPQTVTLVESYDGAVKFDILELLESQPHALAGAAGAKDQSSLLWFLPIGTPEPRQLPGTQSFILNCLGIGAAAYEDAAARTVSEKPCDSHPVTAKPSEIAQQATLKFFQDAKADKDHNWEQAEALHIEFNDNSLLAMTSDQDGYTGGAHGYHNTIARVFDLTAARVLKTSDLFASGATSAIQALLDQRFRHDQDAPPTAKLKEDEGLFVSTIPLTDNFYLDRAGITFVYPPYTIGPWAAGQIELTLSWKSLARYLKPESPIRRLLK